MKKGFYSVFGLSLLAVFLFGNQVLAQVTIPRVSPAAELTQRIGITDVTINYSRPSVNDRDIWGTPLAHYGYINLGFGTATASPWRSGANENTTIEFSTDVKVGGQDLSAGKYGLFMALFEDGSAEVVFSNNTTSWGSFFYIQDEDALRVKVQSGEAPMTEQMRFEFSEVTTTSGVAALVWEKKRIPFQIDAATHDIVIASLKDELRSSTGFSSQAWNQAASYCLQNDVELEQGLQWAEASINAPFIGQKNFNNMSTKAQLLAKLDRAEDSQKTMDDALPMGSIFQVHQYGRTLISQGDKDKALEIFKWNAKTNPNTWPVNYGLARAYSAKGDYKTALKHLKMAKPPESNTGEQQAVAANIKKLESGEDIN